jgi:sulfite exporter TauE/SafE
MIGLIEEHNVLTGYRFVIVEYVLTGLVLGLFGAWELAVGRPVDGLTWLGITANCLVIALLVGLALAESLRRGVVGPRRTDRA